MYIDSKKDSVNSVFIACGERAAINRYNSDSHDDYLRFKIQSEKNKNYQGGIV